MKKWDRTSLGDLLSLERRPVTIQPDKEYQEIGIYCFGKGVFHKQPRTGFEVGNKDLFLVKEGDLIFQITFAWEGALALMSEQENGMYASTRFPTFRVDKEKCIPDFLLYYFRTAEGRDQLVKISPGSAGRNRVLSIKRIPEIFIPLPSLPEQLRIMEKVKEIVSRIEKIQKLKMVNIQEVDSLVDSKLKQIISGAEEKKLWEFGSIPKYAEVNPSRKGQIDLSPDTFVSFVPMSAVDDVSGAIIETHVKEYYQVSKGYTWFKEGDVIFARITPCMQNGKSAVAINLKNGHGFGSTEFHVLRAGPKILAEWLHILVRSKDFRKDAGSHFKGTAGQQRVPQSFLEQKVIPVPSIPEQKKLIGYFKKLKGCVAKVRKIDEEAHVEFNALSPSILDKAFKGELV